ncbi:MAG: P-loop NTPase fold protein [Deltaproteobacteria bacterium]|nr:P-loop NTPase fold protein [Deltaproteobacteria bacterium]
MDAKRLKPRPLVIADDEGFENTDLFGLSEYGERLADLVCNVEDPLVTILDGPWGSGKTIFAKQWAGLMRNRGARVIYFDAFANDHYEDALTPLAAQILSALPNEKRIKKIKKKFKAATLEIVKHYLPVTANLLVQSASGFVPYGAPLIRGAGLVIEKMLKTRLGATDKEDDAFRNFRNALRKISEIPAKLESKLDTGADFPLVFIIDELDRCRPIFAINLIEHVKHLFSVSGVQFLLVAHLPQLEEAVRHCYGLGLGGRAKIYLEKFYDVKMVIPAGRIVPPVGKYIQHLWKEFGISSSENPKISELRDLCLENVVEIHRISFRTIEKILANIALAYSVMPHDSDAHTGFLVEGLCIIRHLNPELYTRICSNSAVNLYNLERHLRSGEQTSDTMWLSDVWNEVKGFFELERWGDSIGARDWIAEWVADCWTYGPPRHKGDGRHLGPRVIHFARIIDSMSTT